MVRSICLASALFTATVAFAQPPADAPFLNPNLPAQRRAADIVSRMTLEEKVLQMQSTAPAIPRLGVPAYNWWNEALHGVVQGRATVFPQAIALAATWDVALMRRVADAIATEARAKYHDAQTRPAPTGPDALATLPGRTAGLTYWSPNINIFRDPRWGRGQETYGEDPYLTARMGVAFVKGMQGDDARYLKVVATPKHYAVHSGPEPERHTFDARVSEADMLDTYLPAFRATVVEGKAESIMCVYNSVNGIPGCASSDLLQKRLRGQWGFTGYVVSDCGAVEDIYSNHKFTSSAGAAAASAVKAGTDLTCGTEYKSLVDEVKAGRISEAEIDAAVTRLFVARFRLGMFDPPAQVPYAKIPIAANDSAEHRALARHAAEEAIVLLKNEGHVLPLRASVRRIAVLGPSADDPVAVLGNYNGISSKQVTTLEGIERQFPHAAVRYALGATYTPFTPAPVPSPLLAPPDGKGHGVLAEYFGNDDLQGAPALARREGRAHFNMDMEPADVLAAVGREKYSIRWTGTLTPTATGEYQLIVRTNRWNRTGKVRMFLDGQELNFNAGPATQLTSQAAPPAIRRPALAKVQLEAGRKYGVRIEFRQPGTGGSIQLSWIPPTAPALAEAQAIVKESDVTIVCVGLSADLEGEDMRGLSIPGFRGGDRTALELPEPQEALIKSAVGTGKPVIVVLTSGSAVALNFAAANAKAVLAAWYAGEEAGSAIAQTLSGASNPAGRLPVTFYTGADQLPPFTDYAMKGRTYRYFTGAPLYPFGFGLSYSTFAYSGLSAKRTPEGAEIRVAVSNTSAVDGDEVAQLYVAGVPGDGGPLRSLRGFQRVRLKAGERRGLTFVVPAEDLPKSAVEISVGGGQPLAGIPHVKGTLQSQAAPPHSGATQPAPGAPTTQGTPADTGPRTIAPYFAPASRVPRPPDAQGFLQRWLLLEPIEKPNRTNTVFTDSYIRDAFATEYFPGQFTDVPRDGDKVTVAGRELAWHGVDSRGFNVKLFRFAYGLNRPTYGVIFWAVTVVTSPRELTNVRMAVGSNSASMWWLNGKEAVILSGDRRMVMDDCVSRRVTLAKGRNVIRGAVINGPGLSDFCVRFIDERGNPIRDLTMSVERSGNQ